MACGRGRRTTRFGGFFTPMSGATSQAEKQKTRRSGFFVVQFKEGAASRGGQSASRY